MSFNSSVVFIFLILSAFVILYVSFKTGKPVRCIFLSSVSGIGSLLAVNILSYATGISLAINPFSLTVSGIGGIGGTVLLLVGNILSGI